MTTHSSLLMGGIILDRSFYDLHYDALYKYLIYMTRDENLARDLLQETFYRFYKQQANDVIFSKALLLKIARNLFYDTYRRKKLIQFVTLAFDERIDPAPLPAMVVEQNEVNIQLYNALAHLSVKQREVIVLRYIEGYSVKETARLLQCSEIRVKNDTTRGLKKLRELLEGGNIYGKAPSKFS